MRAGPLPLGGAIRLARLVFRESAPGFAAVAALAGAVALLACARAVETVPGGRAATGLSVALFVAKVLATATTALVGALVVPRHLASGEAVPLLARPLGRGAYLVGAALGAAAVGVLAGVIPLVLAAGALRAGWLGPDAAARAAPRAALAAAAHAPDPEPGATRVTLGARSPKLEWRFERLEAVRGRGAARLSIRPEYVLAGGVPGEARALVRLRAHDAAGALQAEQILESQLGHRRGSEVPVAGRFLAPDVARLEAVVALPEPGTAASFDLVRELGQERYGVALEAPGAPLEAGLGLALLGLALQAAVVAALAALASTFLSEWASALLALTLAIAAWSRERIGDFAGALARAQHTHTHGGETHVALEAPGPAWLTGAADAAGRALAALLPDLSGLDLAASIARGRLGALDPAAVGRSAVVAAAALLLGWAIFRAREVHGGGRA